MGSQPDRQFKGRVLLTGGTGFIASHVLDTLLAEGFSVLVTVRSEEKGHRLLSTASACHSQAIPAALSFAVVRDIAEDGAFDAAVQSTPPLDYVVHTASPYHLNVQDPVKDFLDPAIKGTTGILRSVHAHAPSVKRVVITSSSAAILQVSDHPSVYDESVWADVTWDDAMDPQKTYKASKVFAERAAWDFVRDQQPAFDLAVINNTFTFGPVQRYFSAADALNTSNQRIRDMVEGRMRDGLPPTAPVFTWVDVRDVALAHVRALTVPEAGGKRFYLVGGHFTNKRIADTIRRAYPDRAGRLPPADDAADDLPADVYQFDNSRSRELLGVQYTSLEKSVLDTVDSILQL